MECLLQSSMFYRFYLFHSIFLCNVDSALVSHSNAYISIWNRIEMFELYSNVRIQIPVLKECVLSTAHTLEKWRLQMMKKKHIKEERDFFTSTPTLPPPPPPPPPPPRPKMSQKGNLSLT